MKFLRLASYSLLIFVVGGCGHALERSRVSREFRAIHDCATANVRSTGGGWIAEGCGVRAHFVCTQRPTGNNQLLGSMLFGDEGCIQDNVDRTAAVGRVSGPPRSPVETRMHPNGFPVVTASFRADLAQLRFIVAPTLEPDAAYLELRLHHSIPDDGTCTWRMWVDGDELPFEGLRIDEHEGVRVRRVKLPVSWLPRISSATRVVGIACGETFFLPASASSNVRELEIRHRELLSAGPDAPALVSH